MDNESVITIIVIAGLVYYLNLPKQEEQSKTREVGEAIGEGLKLVKK